MFVITECFLVFISLLSVNSELTGNGNSFQSLGRSSQIFAADIYEKLTNSSGNILFSPLSAQTVLALLQIGTRGLTQSQLSAVSHLPEDNLRVAELFNSLTKSLTALPSISLNIANKFYIRHDISILPNFHQLSTMCFNTEFQKGVPENALIVSAKINQWVRNKTNNRIRSIIDANDITTNTLIMLINILYFNAKWDSPFEKEFSHERPFFVNGGEKKINVNMMVQLKTFSYYENGNLKAKFLELPYKDQDFVMTIVLPNEKDGLSKLESKIRLVFEKQPYKEYETAVILPKFKIEGRVDLKNVLDELGASSLFNGADLSGMTSQKDARVSKIVQKTYINVDEAGIEAASATAVSIEDRMAKYNQKSFVADHPFLFFIQQKSTGIILFTGRLTEL